MEQRTYTIDFHTNPVWTEDVTGKLEDAMHTADKLATETGKDITIFLKEKVAATRKWNAVPYGNDQPKQKHPICFKDGYYSDWQ